MADSELTELTEETNFAGDELVYVVDDPTGTPLDRKATIQNVVNAIVDAARIRALGFFDTSNDGTGSGLDADLVDGNEATALLARANHTGSQASSTISDFTEAVEDVAGAFVSDGTTVTFTYDDVAGTLTAEVQNLTSSNLSDFTEAVEDTAGSLVSDTVTVAWTYDDVNGTLSAAVQGLSLSDISDSGALAALDTVGTSQIDDDAVTYAKMQDVSATDRLLGRDTAGAGTVEEISPSAARTMLDLYTTGEVDSAISTHNADTTSVHGITDTSTLLVSGDIGSTVQGHDDDLDTFGGLTPSDDDVLQRKAGAWTNRTVAQLRSDLDLDNASRSLNLNFDPLTTFGASSTTEDSALTSTLTIPANTLSAGDSVELVWNARHKNDSGSSNDYTWTVVLDTYDWIDWTITVPDLPSASASYNVNVQLLAKLVDFLGIRWVAKALVNVYDDSGAFDTTESKLVAYNSATKALTSDIELDITVQNTVSDASIDTLVQSAVFKWTAG